MGNTDEETTRAQRIWGEVQSLQVEIDDATPDDVYAVRQVQRETWLATYPNEEHGITRDDIAAQFAKDETPAGRQKLENRKESYADPTIHTWVAKDSDTIIGFCSGKKGDDSNRIWSIYILPEHQGRGVGKLLMTASLIWLGDDKDIYLDVASYNAKAIAFYERFGFVESGREVVAPVSPLPSGKSIPEIEMVKRKNR